MSTAHTKDHWPGQEKLRKGACMICMYFTLYLIYLLFGDQFYLKRHAETRRITEIQKFYYYILRSKSVSYTELIPTTVHTLCSITPIIFCDELSLSLHDLHIFLSTPSCHTGGLQKCTQSTIQKKNMHQTKRKCQRMKCGKGLGMFFAKRCCVLCLSSWW